MKQIIRNLCNKLQIFPSLRPVHLVFMAEVQAAMAEGLDQHLGSQYFLLTNDGAMAVHSSFAMPY